MLSRDSHRKTRSSATSFQAKKIRQSTLYKTRDQKTRRGCQVQELVRCGFRYSGTGSMWIPVPPLPDAILVILSDQTEIMTNGKYKSVVHRAVVNAEHARLSVATFYDPPKSQKICTAPQLVSKDHPQKYQDVIYGDYVTSWYRKGPEGKRNIDALLIEQ